MTHNIILIYTCQKLISKLSEETSYINSPDLWIKLDPSTKYSNTRTSFKIKLRRKLLHIRIENIFLCIVDHFGLYIMFFFIHLYANFHVLVLYNLCIDIWKLMLWLSWPPFRINSITHAY